MSPDSFEATVRFIRDDDGSYRIDPASVDRVVPCKDKGWELPLFVERHIRTILLVLVLIAIGFPTFLWAVFDMVPAPASCNGMLNTSCDDGVRWFHNFSEWKDKPFRWS